MKNALVNRVKDIPSFLMHLFGFLLLWEWLRPLSQITDTAEIGIFISFIGLCFLLSFLNITFVASTVIKVLTILYMLNSVYFEQSILSISWLKSFLYDTTHNISLIFKANWWDMSAVFRSLLFFILLWLMCYLISYWMIHQKRILLFFIMSIIYVTVLDTFSPYIANGAIIRLVLIGFVMLGILHMERLIKVEKITRYSLARWIIPIVVITILSTSIGYFAPKAAPQWPDPVPYLKGYGKGGVAPGSSSVMKKIGYGTNDSHLGGPFIGDSTPVFEAKINKRHYWRIETKDVYSGKGWESSSNPKNIMFDQENSVLSWFESDAETQKLEADISMKLDYAHIVYPSGLESVKGNRDVVYSVDPLTEKISTRWDDAAVALEDYSIKYDYPIFDVDQLKLVSGGNSLETDPEFVSMYTQLPESLPDRVRDLATEITTNKTNRYDQVIAVERYFKENAFVYDTKDVPVPGRNEDYVDQFLFETQSGYCDNFSTSMIILLRSAGIPARWVKGYTAGTYVDTLNVNQRLYEVTNNNAHSWVEVYFPNQGWVPFEPTKGFSNLADFVYNTSTTTNNDLNQEIEEAIATPAHEMLEEGQTLLEGEEYDLTGKPTTTWYEKISISWLDLFMSVISILLITYVVIKTRMKWYPYIAILLYKRRRDDIVYFKAYFALLKQLERSGLKRMEGQTLRDYAIYVDKFLRSNDMVKLTLSYEKALYRKDNAQIEWQKSVELWENLIKKVSS